MGRPHFGLNATKTGSTVPATASKSRSIESSATKTSIPTNYTKIAFGTNGNTKITCTYSSTFVVCKSIPNANPEPSGNPALSSCCRKHKWRSKGKYCSFDKKNSNFNCLCTKSTTATISATTT